MATSYSNRPGDSALCFICDRWWLILLLLLLALVAYLLRNIWIPTSNIETQVNTPELGTGDVQITLTWNSTNDLDLWVTDPFGETIYYYHTTSASQGQLDVDANRNCQNVTSSPVENIFWPSNSAPSGNYTVTVHYYMHCENEVLITPYQVRLLVDGIVKDFDGKLSTEKERQEVTTFER